MKIFLDTHIVIWLYQKELKLLSALAIQNIEESTLFISPIVMMEIEYLHEIKKISVNWKTIIDYLSKKIGLNTSDSSWNEIIQIAINEKWTRDPFDRLIVADAKYHDCILISKDKKIRKNYKKTVF